MKILTLIVAALICGCLLLIERSLEKAVDNLEHIRNDLLNDEKKGEN